MVIFENIYEDNFERIVFCYDKCVGLKFIIVIHNMVLGPVTGGCCMWDYKTEDEVIMDVFRFFKGMTYKASILKLSMGGGKSVIIGDVSKKTPALLQRFGEFVEELCGGYVMVKDVGINSVDLKIVKSRTSYIFGIDGESNSFGDFLFVMVWGV